MTRAKKWTDDEIKKLTELYKTQLSLEEIASLLGRSFDSVAKKGNRLNLTKVKKQKVVQWGDFVYEHIPEHPQAFDSNGYVYQHILVAEKMLGRRLKEDELVYHVNGDKTDNRPENLKVTTKSKRFRHRETSKVKTAKTKAKKGKEHHNAKMDKEKVIKARSMYEEGMSQRDIAEHFDVSFYTINCIINRKTWKHVE